MSVAALASLTALACAAGAHAVSLDWPAQPAPKKITPFGGEVTAWGKPMPKNVSKPVEEIAKIQQRMRILQGRIAKEKKLGDSEKEEHSKLNDKLQSMQEDEEDHDRELAEAEKANADLATTLGKQQSVLKPPKELLTELAHHREIEAGLTDFRDHRLPLLQAEVHKFKTVKEHLKGNISQLEAELMAISEQLVPLQTRVRDLELKKKPLLAEANRQRMINKKLQAHLDDLKGTFWEVKHGQKLTEMQTANLQRQTGDTINAEDYDELMRKLGEETLHSSATRQFLVKQQKDLKITLAELRANITKTQREEHMLTEKVRGIMPQITQLYAENAQLDMEAAKYHQGEILAQAESKLVAQAVHQATHDLSKSLKAAEEKFMADLSKVEHTQL